MSEASGQAAGPVRLFVALDLPDAVRDRLAGWAGTEVGGRTGVRLVSPGSLHVTLCFLGAQAAAEVDAIGRACVGAVDGCGPGSVGLSFGDPLLLPRRRPRALAVAVDDIDGRLAPLQAATADALAAGGWYASERRRFLAHITVARLRPAAAAELRVDRLAAPSGGRFVAWSVSLYRSHTGPAGARYEPLARVTLER